MIAILYFAGAILTTLVVVVMLCRNRLAIRKKSFYLIALAGMTTANVIFSFAMLVAGRAYAERSRMFSSETWKNLDADGAMIMGFFGIIISVLPTLAVAYYYEKQSKKMMGD